MWKTKTIEVDKYPNEFTAKPGKFWFYPNSLHKERWKIDSDWVYLAALNERFFAVDPFDVLDPLNDPELSLNITKKLGYEIKVAAYSEAEFTGPMEYRYRTTISWAGALYCYLPKAITKYTLKTQ
jgi:hypothetical protein